MKYEKINNFTPPKQKHHFKIEDKVKVIHPRWAEHPSGSILTITRYGIDPEVIWADNNTYLKRDLEPIT